VECKACNEICTRGCYDETGICIKPILVPVMVQIPEKPTSYVLSLSRPIDAYEDYSEIFQVGINPN